eukprot:COSAG06_NODE_4509_length_4193_cov_11.274792_2_plen_387_part_00
MHELRHGFYSWVGPAVRARPLYCSGRPVAARCCMPLSSPCSCCARVLPSLYSDLSLCTLCLLTHPPARVCFARALPQTDGGYLGVDIETFFSSVTSGASGVFSVTLLEDAGISTDLTITPGQTVSVSGDPSLPQAPSWGGGSFTVQERGSLALTGVAVEGAISVLGGGTASLSRCTLEDSVSLTTTGGGSLSLASMAVPASVLGEVGRTLSGVGSILRLDVVTVPEVPGLEATGTVLVGTDGSKADDPPGSFPGFFLVFSGPCTVSEGGRCVGRPDGYGPSEDCDITVGGGGVLRACTVFDTMNNGVDLVTLPGTLPDAEHEGSDCPVGAVLAPGDAIAWTSNTGNQGTVGCSGTYSDNGCAAKGTCGLSWSQDGLGGGWQICFAA